MSQCGSISHPPRATALQITFCVLFNLSIGKATIADSVACVLCNPVGICLCQTFVLTCTLLLALPLAAAATHNAIHTKS